MKKIIQRGAEAILYLNHNKLVKERIKKGYRHEAIDKQIRKKTTRRETKLLDTASSEIPVPKVYESSDSDMKIVMEFIDGKRIKDILDRMNETERKKICFKIGEQVALLHNKNMIHGDVTTSNMILKEGKIYFIDFGLGFFSTRVEDKAVDLHLLKQALESKHYKHFEESFNEVMNGYKKTSNNFKAIEERFIKVESRGRYKGKS